MIDLSGYWAEHPPLQAMVQAYLGIKPKSQKENDDEFDALLGAVSTRA